MVSLAPLLGVQCPGTSTVQRASPVILAHRNPLAWPCLVGPRGLALAARPNVRAMAVALPADPGADPAVAARVMAAIAHGGSGVPPACDANEAKVLYADAGFVFLDVRSAEELDSEGKVLPNMPRSLHVPLVDFAKRYDAAAGRKVVTKTPNAGFVDVVQRVVPDKAAGIILICSGVPSQGALRSAAARDALRAAGYTRLTVMEAGYADWAIKFTNKLERRVVGFVIASGGTSIEQNTAGASSKGSGVAGKSAEELRRDQLANYMAGGMYAD